MSKIGYNIRQAAKALGVSEGEIVSAVQEGELRSYRVEGKCLVLASDLRKWVRAHPLYLPIAG